jgi:hypothetical protein
MRKLLSSMRRRFLGETLWRLPDQLPADLDVLRREGDVLRLNVKTMGYRIAQEMASDLPSVDISGEPRRRGLSCKATTQADVESPWFAYWCKELKIAPMYHRKLWEYAYVLQALFEHDKLDGGRHGLGFGCGEEPIASYLASRGLRATVTDLDPSAAKGRGWMETGQHTSALDQAYRSDLVARDRFEQLVRLEYVDMNAIPSHLEGRYDFCWSICAMEHLGSIEQGMRFVERAMATLNAGGLAVHTTEFNYLSEDDTVDDSVVVLFLRKHFVALKTRLERAGHRVMDLDFDRGDSVLDRYVDVPPYAWEGPQKCPWGIEHAHLKLSVFGYPCTCFGLIVQKAP